MTEQPWDDAPACYKTKDPEVLAEWDAAQERFVEFRARMKTWMEQFPDHEPMALQGNDGIRLAGLKGASAPGPVWRRKQTRYGLLWSPDKRTKIGKAIYAEILEIRAQHMPTIPGMPDLTVVGARWCHPGLFVHRRVAYVSWSCSFSEVEVGKGGWSKTSFDPERWIRIKRSELYAAKEKAGIHD